MATAKKDPVIEEEAPAVEMVRIKLPLTREQQDDVFVRVNQETFLIKRGEYVEVPRYVVEVLDHSERAMLEALQFEEKHAKPID